MASRSVAGERPKVVCAMAADAVRSSVSLIPSSGSSEGGGDVAMTIYSEFRWKVPRLSDRIPQQMFGPPLPVLLMPNGTA
jgi:hypothetical protein